MIQQVGDPVECDGSLSASCSSLNNENPVFCVADDRILLFLNGADDIFQLHLTTASKLSAQDIIIDLHVAFECVDHFSSADFILPSRGDFSGHRPTGCFIGGRPLLVIIKQTADRRAPVIDQRKCPVSLCKCPDADIKTLRLLFSFVLKIDPPEKRGVQHALQVLLLLQCGLIGVYLLKKCLLIVIIFVSILVHFRIIFPVIVVHVMDFLLPMQKGFFQCKKPVFYFFGYIGKICIAVCLIYHE